LCCCFCFCVCCCSCSCSCFHCKHFTHHRANDKLPHCRHCMTDCICLLHTGHHLRNRFQFFEMLCYTTGTVQQLSVLLNSPYICVLLPCKGRVSCGCCVRKTWPFRLLRNRAYESCLTSTPVPPGAPDPGL
jgi:hypothetical protein